MDEIDFIDEVLDKADSLLSYNDWVTMYQSLSDLGKNYIMQESMKRVVITWKTNEKETISS